MTYRWLVLPVLTLSLCVACSSEGSSGPPFGTGGIGGTAGTGSGGTGGPTGGGGGEDPVPKCVTSALCGACPDDPACTTDDDCAVGHACIDSGCTTDAGVPIGQCTLIPSGACQSDADCPPGRECVAIPGEGDRCVKPTSGCDSDFDCVLGFSCEAGTCVDRRVPCFLDAECPKSHLCFAVDATRFCLRMHQACDEDFDCFGLAPHCADIDGDGDSECAGAFDPNAPTPEPCVNSSCGGATPVCEVGFDSAFTACGEYGPCFDDGTCSAGFECLALWPDGSRECVPSEGSCDEPSDCPERQVCASPREGGPPACQAGLGPS